MPKQRYAKDADGYYYVNVPTGKIRKDGYRQYTRLKAKTQPELDEKRRAYEEACTLGVTPDEKITVDQWYALWITKYKGGVAENTREYYKNIYKKHIAPAIGRMQLRKIRVIDAQGILSAMAETHAESTVKGVRKTLFALFETAADNKLIVSNPCEKLKAAGRKKKERRALTPEEREAYLRQCKTDPFGTYAALLYFFGLRRGEALALTGKDVSATEIRINKQITYPGNNAPVLKDMPKTDAGARTIPIPDKARLYIDFDNLPSGLLVSAPSGQPLTYSPLVDAWNRFIKSALGPDTDITPHCLRHNYCCLLFEAGADPLTVKNLAGHEDIKTTLEIYTHWTESLQQQGREKALKIG